MAKKKHNNIHHSSGNNQVNKFSYAPYNFIPLNEKLVELKKEKGDLTGYIDLTIITKSLIYIRGEGSDFFKINGVPPIPGSEIRGMLSTLVEIMSYGKFRFFDDTTYFRRLMINEGKNFKTGFLKYKEGNYVIEESESSKKVSNSNIRYPLNYSFKQDYCEFSTGIFGRSFNVWKFKKKSKPNSYKVSNKIKTKYDNDKTRSGVPNVFLCSKRKSIEIKIGRDKFKTFKTNSFGMPVFFLVNEQGEVTHISHCKLGRIQYEKTVVDKIPEEIRPDSKKTDFVDCIFGTTENSGKIYVEDAFIDSKENYYFDKENNAYVLKPLSSPKPTAYQMYLETENGITQNWNKNTNIRGHKLYWHRLTKPDGDSGWKKRKATAQDSKDKKENGVYSYPVKPIKKKVKFIGRIRFEDMTPLELGALLSAIQLPENCCHKIGMAKPLGFGSISIKPSLTIINQSERYNNPLKSKGGIEPSKDIKCYIDKFKDYIKEGLELQKADCYWEIDRMKQLKTMLFFDKVVMAKNDWLKKTSYMEIRPENRNEKFDKNKPLPKPTKAS